METTNESPVLVFSKEVEALSKNFINDKKGFLLFAYEELEGTLASSFSSSGNIPCMAECLCSCMKQNEVLANIVIAASNAIVQGRMMAAQIMAEAAELQEPKKSKKKTTKKPKN